MKKMIRNTSLIAVVFGLMAGVSFATGTSDNTASPGCGETAQQVGKAQAATPAGVDCTANPKAAGCPGATNNGAGH